VEIRHYANFSARNAATMEKVFSGLSRDEIRQLEQQLKRIGKQAESLFDQSVTKARSVKGARLSRQVVRRMAGKASGRLSAGLRLRRTYIAVGLEAIQFALDLRIGLHCSCVVSPCTDEMTGELTLDLDCARVAFALPILPRIALPDLPIATLVDESKSPLQWPF